MTGHYHTTPSIVLQGFITIREAPVDKLMDKIAIDIETIPLVQDPEFDNPAHWDPFAVALGHLNSSMTDPDVKVIFREMSTLEAEAQLLNDSLDWIAERSSSTDRVLITYNGESYDIPILMHRASQLRRSNPGSNAFERLFLLLESSSHVDLIKRMKARKGYYVSLEGSLEEFDITFDEPEWCGKTIAGSDMPSMGLELLAERAPGANSDLREAVRRYAASDVAPLFELHDKLQEERIVR